MCLIARKVSQHCHSSNPLGVNRSFHHGRVNRDDGRVNRDGGRDCPLPASWVTVSTRTTSRKAHRGIKQDFHPILCRFRPPH